MHEEVNVEGRLRDGESVPTALCQPTRMRSVFDQYVY